MPNSPEPQVLPPTSRKSGLSDESLDILATLLDDYFRLPGTSIRFGLDPLIGLIPGLGDTITGVASFLIVLAAWQRGLPKVTITRMVANIGVDTFLGSLPFLGDAFDVAWKSNRRNVELLKRSQYARGKQVLWHDWLFLLLIVLTAAALIAVPIVVLWWLIHLVHYGT